MASQVSDLISRYQASQQHMDPRVKNWLLLNESPVYVWLLTAAYVVFVWLGPKFMRKREAWSLNWVLVVYNLGLVALSVYMFVEVVVSAWRADYNFFCDAYNEETIKDPRQLRVAKVMWWYFFSKAIELIDTVLMVLRKKNRQITFLHVFHHVSMLNLWWWVMMFNPGGVAFFGAAINSFIHIIMYTYYGLSAIPALRKHLWWKKYLTRCQLFQFVVTLAHTLNSMFIMTCDFPSWGQYTLCSYLIMLLALFTNFYVQSYRRHSSAKQAHAQSPNSKQLNQNIQNGVYKNGVTHIDGLSEHRGEGKGQNLESNGQITEKKSQ